MENRVKFWLQVPFKIKCYKNHSIKLPMPKMERFHGFMLTTFNSFMTEVTIIYKPVH